MEFPVDFAAAGRLMGRARLLPVQSRLKSLDHA